MALIYSVLLVCQLLATFSYRVQLSNRWDAQTLDLSDQADALLALNSRN
jgi:hypothetical protein